MPWKDFLQHPLSSIRQWALEHERFIAVNVSWTLAVVFIIIAIAKLLISFGIL